MGNPFHIAFCAEDDQIAAEGGAASLLARLIKETAEALQHAGFPIVGFDHFADLGNGFQSLNFDGVTLAVLWQGRDRAMDREQWSVAFWSTPQFEDLTPAQRSELAQMHALITLYLADQHCIAAVDVALPAGFAIPGADPTAPTGRAH